MRTTIAKIVASVVGLIMLFGVIGLAAGWWDKGVEVVSADNVSVQYTQLQEDYQSLEATARNVCTAEQSVQDSESADERTQRRSQLVARQANYERIAADYDRRWANAFEAKYVGPRSLPTDSPTLEEMKTKVCPAA